MKKWQISPADPEKVKKINEISDLGPLLSEIMAARGIDTEEKLDDFYNSDKLSDPFLLLDMEAAVEAINSAVDAEEHITVFGDYDCDGICATAILYSYLISMGADVDAVIPEREDGYGLNMELIEKMNASGTKLIITVDNGISAVSESKRIAQLGMKLVITDHHQPSDTLPEALATVDPHRSGDFSEFKNLCGAGVALKLCAALDGGNYNAVCEQYLDLAAIATVADVVPLTGENRIIVSRGLALLKNTENLGLLALIENCGLTTDKLSSQSLAFTLAPRINAASRFGSARMALDMLICENGKEKEYAKELVALNRKRREIESGIMDEIFSVIDSDPVLRYSRVLTVAGKNWHRGIIGIIAARLVDIYGRPALVISIDDDGIAAGSARSIKGFNVFKCFDYCRELLIKYGGHELAGGLTIAEDKIPELRKMIESYAAAEFPVMPKLTITADKLLRGVDITYANAVSLRRIQPCGAGNPEPVFALSGAVISAVYPLSGGEHTKLNVNYDGTSVQVLMFRQKTSEFMLKQGDRIDLMANMQTEEYNGNRRVTLLTIDWRPHAVRQEKFFAASGAYEKFRRGEPLNSELLSLGMPTRDEMVTVYNLLKNSGGEDTYENLYAKLCASGINAFKLKIIIDSFCDTDLMDYKRGRARLKRPTAKVDIMSCKTIKLLELALDKRENGTV